MQFDNKVWELNRHKIAFEIKGVTDGVMGLHSSDEILFLPNEELV